MIKITYEKMETSKFILFVVITVAIAIAAAVVVGCFLGHDMTQAAVVSGGWDVVVGVAVGYYYWKAKNENRSKHAMKLVKELADKYGIENINTLAGIVLKD